jgi:hypothetical protein
MTSKLRLLGPTDEAETRRWIDWLDQVAISSFHSTLTARC